MKTILSLLTLVIVALAVAVYYLYQHQPRIAFIDTAYVYNNFNMKKELEKKLLEIKRIRQQSIDSLYEAVSAAQTAGNGEAFPALEKNYVRQREKAGLELEQIQTDYDQQIWKQINSLVSRFGNERGLSLILGANGGGNLMHGDDTFNLSEDVLNYINTHYEGR